MTIFFDKGPEGQPARFLWADELILAWTPDEVPAAMAAMQAAQDEGRWLAGYASYELGYVLEPRLRPLLPASRRVPLLAFAVCDAPMPDPGPQGEGTLGALVPDWDAADYAARFRRLADYIAAGDCYQVNLTLPLRGRASGSAEGLYAALRARQPVGHGAYLDLGVGPAILSRSPELFFRLTGDGRIETAPMKGTAPRDPDAERDAALKEALRQDVKNRAENLMIVDLLRNDISRLSEVGSVRVPTLFEVESYATVHQMISRIEGRLRPGWTIGGLFTALFPCGSVTGAPKIRAMEIIRELEPSARNVYCGAIGWLAPDGRAEFNVAIRTLMLFPDGEVVLNVGGGVVQDSTAEGEYEEALWKARFARTI